jgi:hypothetical protein
MANDLSKPGGKALSDSIVQSLLGGIADSRASTPIAGGKPLLRLLKSGVWVFGQADDPVQEGSTWAINPLSIKHGFSCWSDYPGNTKNELLGEVLAPVSDRKPMMPEPISDFGWKEERVFDLKCTLGDDEGTEVLYKTSSIGGMRAVDNFLAALSAQLQKDPLHPVAIVQLTSNPYDHNKFGQIFNPIFEVTGWATMTGELEDEEFDAIEDQQEGGSAPAAPATVAAKAPIKTPLRPAAANSAAPTTGRPGAAPKRQRPENRA